MRILVRGATLSLQVLVLLVVASTCRAQTTVTLEEAVTMALESRPLLKAESERIVAVEGRKRQAGARPNPDFQFLERELASRADVFARCRHPCLPDVADRPLRPAQGTRGGG